jgi:predicted transglutaminase-like cysteine proteinase
MLLSARFLSVVASIIIAQPAFSGQPPSDNNVLPPFGHAVFCAGFPHDCEKVDGTANFRLPSSTRWFVINYINSTVNQSIQPIPARDAIESRWLISPDSGDCADYAVTKRHKLLELGWPSHSLLLAEVVLIATGEHHLVLVVKDAAGEWVLDNLKPVIVRVSETRAGYWWRRIESGDDPRVWNRSFPG